MGNIWGVFGIWAILGLFFGEARRPFHSGGMVVLEKVS